MAVSDKMKDTAAKAKQGATAEKAHLKESAHEAETFATEHGAEASSASPKCGLTPRTRSRSHEAWARPDVSPTMRDSARGPSSALAGAVELRRSAARTFSRR